MVRTHRTSRLCAIPLICLLIFSILVVSPPRFYARGIQGLSGNSWSTFHGDTARTGFSEGSGPRFPKSLWNFTAIGAIGSSPVVAQGIVYFGAGDGNLYAANESNGQLVWRTQIGNVGTSSPVVYDGSVYAHSSFLYRLNASSGSIIWRVSMPGASTSLLAYGGSIFAAEYLGSRIHSVDAKNGSINWSFNVSLPGESAYSNGLVYIGSTDKSSVGRRIYALNATSGVVVWTYESETGIIGGLTVSEGILYGGGHPYTLGNFTALNATTGSVIWKLDLPVVGPPGVAYGRLYIQGGTGLVCLNKTNGAILWGFSFRGINAISHAVPAIAGGVVFVGGGGVGDFPDPTYYALDAITGRLLWFLPVVGSANDPPAVSNGNVYLGSGNGTLYAIGNGTVPTSMPTSQLTLPIVVAAAGVTIAALAVLRRARKGSRTAGSQINR